MQYDMEELLEQANEVQETLSRSYAVPDEIDEVDLEAGTSYSIPGVLVSAQDRTQSWTRSEWKRRKKARRTLRISTRRQILSMRPRSKSPRFAYGAHDQSPLYSPFKSFYSRRRKSQRLSRLRSVTYAAMTCIYI